MPSNHGKCYDYNSGTLDTAKQLAADYEGAQNKLQSLPWSPPTHIGANFHDKDLGSLTAMGVAVHHAGLSLDDRKAVEDLYLEKKLHVLVATSTLAVGVNLPAHIVVIKGVKLYQNGETREYSDLEVLQMMGRAGRPQFDDEGIAIILCELELENKYRALAQGTTTIESSLHKNMAEHLNSEIGLGTIADVASAKNWLRCKTENETWRDNIDEVVVQTIRNLHDTQLIMYNERDGTLSSTEYGDIMSKFYVRQTTMRSILELPATASIRQILEMLSSAEELVDFKLRGGERQLLNRRPPFGSEVLVAAKEFPRYFLGVKEVAIAASHGNDPVEVKLSIECGLIPDSTASQKCKTSRRMGAEMTNLLTLTSDLIFIDFRRIATRALVDKKEFVLNVHLTKPSQTISVYIAPDKFAGLTVTTTYKPSIAPSMFPTVDTRPLTAVEWDLQGLEDTPDLWEINISDDERTCDAPSMDLTTEALDEDTHSLKIPTTSSQVQNIERLMERRPKVRSDGKYECNHPCKNKSKCRHYCCKEGLTEPPRSLKKKQGTRAEPFKVTASREKPPGKTYNPFTKRGSPRRRTNHVAHVARFRDSKSGSKQRADQPRRGPTPPCNQISTLRQALLPTKLNYPKSGNRTKVTPNFDLELTSLRSNSPVVESGPMVDDGLRMISEILKNERSPTPDTNYSNSEVDAMIRELPLDTDQQTVCKRDARHLDFEQHKRSSQSSHHMDYDNPVKRPKITQVRLSPYQEEKSTFPVSTPLAPKPSLFLSSPSDNGNEEFVQRLRDDADQPGGIASPSLPTHQSPAYNDDFYFDDTCSDLFSATISETPANVPYIEDQPRDTTRTRHTSPPRSCEPREEITAYGRAQATSDYLVATASKGSLELLPPSRISGFLSRQTLDADKSMCLSEWTEPRNCPRKGMPPVLGTPPVQQLTLDARTLVTLASVETSVPPTHPEDYTNVTRDDPLAEFDSWLASGAVDIVDIE
ncbi:hypothetical protein ID866_3612 [Astraeus odoratus]|nr:hypothetical protein ID866_3612 [Astraeus odoratus]